MSAKEKRDRVLKEIIKPAMKKAGFRTSGNYFVKKHPDLIQVMVLENRSWNSAEFVSFDLDLGLLFTFLPERHYFPLRDFPHPTACDFSIDAIQLTDTNKWIEIYAHSDDNELNNYFSNLLDNYILPFFQHYSIIENCIDLHTKYTASLSFDRTTPLIGLALMEKGQLDEGKKLLNLVHDKSYPSEWREKYLAHGDHLISKYL
jgi:hypothetical protein